MIKDNQTRLNRLHVLLDALVIGRLCIQLVYYTEERIVRSRS